MSDIETFVYVHHLDKDLLVGKLWTHFNNGKETASFKYDEGWLKNSEAFELEPSLPLCEGTFHTSREMELFGCFSDCSPDSWGRLLIRRNEVAIARIEKRNIKQLNQIDYMLGVNDFARHGALRFKSKKEGDFLTSSDKKAIPSLVDLPKLLSSSQKVLDENETYADIKELLAPGTSLGGARPKASVLDREGNLFIAKFPKKDDSNNNVLWEAVALTLADRVGLNVQKWMLKNVMNKSVLLLKRFDRLNQNRIPFISGMTMLGAKDGENQSYSYLDLAEIIRLKSDNVQSDLKELWNRILFSVLISNTDDHLRNHGFLIDKGKMKLSPLYDVNPNAERTKNLQLCIDENNSSTDVELVLSVADYFCVSNPTEIFKSMKNKVSEWYEVAKSFGISSKEIDYMSQAFEK